MSSPIDTLCFVVLVIALGACFIRAFWGLEAALERRKDRQRLLIEAIRHIQPAADPRE